MKLSRIWISLFICFPLLNHCAWFTKKQFVQETSQPTETIVIMGTNDLHGSIAPQHHWTRENNISKAIPYESAGAATLATYIHILRSEFGNRLIWLDAGDEFQGSIESNLNHGAPMVEFFNRARLDAAAIGNHEFDFGLPILKTRMKEAHYTYLSSNITQRASGKFPDFPNSQKHKIITIGDLKIGVFGLSTLDTPKTTRPEYVSSLQFNDLVQTALEEVRTLRNLGAQIILLTAHVGSHSLPTEITRSDFFQPIVRSQKRGQYEGRNEDELVQFLRALPPGTIDAVVSGHTHQIIHHWIAGVPVIQAGVFGNYFNLIYLTYDRIQKKVLPEKTLIEGPVPVCTKIFKNQNNCNGDEPTPAQGRGPLIPNQFHGKLIQPDPEIEAFLKPIIQQSESIKNKVIGHAEQPIDHFRRHESPLGNLVANAVKEAAHADVALVNPGGLRAPLHAGAITYGDIFRTMPFENQISVLKVTPDELKLIFQVAESGSRELYPIAGLMIRMIHLDFPAPYDDLNKDGLLAPWKKNRIIELKIDPLPAHAQYYQLATLDFLVAGGDDLKWPMSQIPPERIQLNSGQLVRSALVSYVQLHSPLNSKKDPLVNPQRPRFDLIIPPSND